MKHLPLSLAWLVAAPLFAADPALTIYNQNFAVVRDTIPLDLKPGVNEVRFADTTAHLESSSVILRDAAGKVSLQIIEQNYRNDPLSQQLLLSLHEGKTIDFVVRHANKPDETILGKIIRSGYVPHSQQAMQRYGQRYSQSQMAMASATQQPVIEVGGRLFFSLPGEPVFPSLGTDTVLKPTLTWQIAADKPGQLNAELAYITGGLSWGADYNVVSPERSDLLDLVGWVTMDNQSGKTFPKAKIKLMAGDVSKVQPENGAFQGNLGFAKAAGMPAGQPVTEKSFDEYHLYTLARPSTLRDRETKQVEFIRASGIKSQRVYVYDGLKIDWNRWRGYPLASRRSEEEIGSDSDTKVMVMREFKNSEANHLGMPLPRGRVRFYMQDADRQVEFTGENTIDHTPKDETLRIYTGNAFDLVGERRRTNFKRDGSNHWVDESYEIKLRNHKTEPVEIRVIEHLFRWVNWAITESSLPHTKRDAQTIEFRIPLKRDEEKTLTYSVHYTW